MKTQKIDMLKTYLCGAFIFVLMFCSMGVFAQVGIMNLRDPLKHPETWKKLRENPIDSALWVEYYGKNWSDFEPEDIKQVTEWKQVLMLRRLAEQETLVGFVIKPEMISAGFFIDDSAFEELVMSLEITPEDEANNSDSPFITRELGEIRIMIMREPETLKNLKSNINENFALIEDTYRDLFLQFDVQYEYYKDVHPKGKLNKTAWIDEQDERLKKLKADQFNQIYKSYVDSQN